jgi:hypothetical protein
MLALYGFFIEHAACPDQHLVTAQRRIPQDASVQVSAMCPACGAVAVVELTAGEAALFDSLPGRSQSQYLQ